MNECRVYFGDHLLVIGGELGVGFPISLEQLEREQLIKLFDDFGVLQLMSDDMERDLVRFAQGFKFVEAAGGVVSNGDGGVLLIHRNGRWDLPKGHREEGESMECCALREVEEETGVGGLTIDRHLINTLHFYQMRGVWELKETTWYAMSVATLSCDLTPQVEEGIDRVEWIAVEDLSEVTEGSFPTVRAVLNEL